MNAKLETLNALRARASKPNLKAWKESNAKLDAAIAKMSAADPTFDVKENESHLKAQLVASIEATEPAEKKPTANAATVTLAGIARELGLNPKICRAKARRAGLKADVDSWTFDAARRDEIVAFLTK